MRDRRQVLRDRVRGWWQRRGTAGGPERSPGTFDSRSPRFPQLIAWEQGIHRLATGFRFTEGPVWLSDEERLLFTDIPASTIYEMDEGGATRVFRRPSGRSNGLTLDRRSRLLACEHENRRLTRFEPDGSLTVLARRFRGARLNSPNDVVVRSEGTIFFTDPAYGIRPEQQKQPVQGVYRLRPGVAPDTPELTLVTADLDAPNGLAFSPDERILYVSDSKRRRLYAFPVRDGGGLGSPELVQDMDGEAPGKPDGLKVDVEGNVYCTGPGGIRVLDPGGVWLGTIVVPEQPANLAWGACDRRDLYITAQTSIYRIRTRVPGIPVPR